MDIHTRKSEEPRLKSICDGFQLKVKYCLRLIRVRGDFLIDALREPSTYTRKRRYGLKIKKKLVAVIIVIIIILRPPR